MAETIRELLIKVGLDGKAAVNGLRQIDGSLASLKRGAMIAIGSIAAIGATVFGVAKSAAHAAVELKKMSTILGIPTEELQRLQGAAKLAEMDIDAFNTSMYFFSKTTGAAMHGGKEQLKAFRLLGITSFKDVNGHMKTQSALLYEVAERLSHVKTIQEKSLIISKMFGRGGGKNMLNFFGGGVEQIKIAENAFKKFGYTLTHDDIKNSEDFTRTLKYLGMAAEGAKNKIGHALIPYLNKWGEEVLKLVGQHRTLKGEMNLFLDAAKITFPTITGYIQNTIDHVSDLIDNMQTLWEKTDKFLHIKEGAKTLWAGGEEGARDFQWLLEGAKNDIKKGMGVDENSKNIYINKKLLEMKRTGDYTGGKYNKERLADYQKHLKTELSSETLSPIKNNINKSPVVINHAPIFNFTIPSGTPESQQDWFKKAASKFSDDAIQKESKNILMAFPQYEGA